MDRYSPQDFVFRLTKLSKVTKKENLEALLVVCGVGEILILDARENSEYVKLVNWLLLGLTGVQILDSEFLGNPVT